MPGTPRCPSAVCLSPERGDVPFVPQGRLQMPKSLNDESFKCNLCLRYGSLVQSSVDSYFQSAIELAKTMDRASFLGRCLNVHVTPKSHILKTDNVQNTWDVELILRRYAERVVKADLDFQRLRKNQVS